MVIVKLIGGLGNQMFQYALGRTLSLLHDAELKLDVSPFDRYKLHGYALGHLNVQENLASAREVRHAKVAGWWNRVVSKTPSQAASPGSWIWVRESSFCFDERILGTKANCYLDGYWQSEKYFSSQANVIRNEFALRSSLDPESNRVAEVIRNSTSVSIHVRRGDYVSSLKTSKIHGTCSADYYREAAALISSEVTDPRFFVFSDDPEWTRFNLPVRGAVTYVTHNGADRNYADLHLMRLCKHHIIANSSFSWWGAWLAASPTKIVVAPKLWFSSASHDTTDLIPDTWIRI